MKKETWFVYIIETENGKLYTGITKDIDKSPKGRGKYETCVKPFMIANLNFLPGFLERLELI